jgi:precorrin-2 dehydrogenase/sirohydrochlorin ferrochelatase
VFLDLRDKPCVVVGGGTVAERKALELIRAGASLKVVSPELTPRLKKEKEKGTIRHTARRFRMSDLGGAFLVVAATDDQRVNEQIAARNDLLVNVVDQPEHCNFIVPSTVRRGPLAIAISTSGTSPAMARAIRLDMERLYGPEFGQCLRDMQKKRARAMKDIADPKERERYLKSLASPEKVAKLRAACSRGKKKK